MPILNDIEQHTVQLSRVATELLKTGIFPSYEAAYKAVRLILLEAESIKSQSKLSAVSKAIDKAIRAATDPAWDNVTEQLNEIAIYESGYYAQLIGGYASVKLNTPPKKQVSEWMQKALMALESGQRTKVGTWAEFVAINQGSFTDAVQGVVKRGYMNGATVNEMVRELRPLVDGLLRNEAEALIRTGVQFYANEGQRQMREANADIIDREMPLVVLDSRTSPTCRHIDSRYHKGWPAGKSPVGYPPYHFGCRTVVVGLVEGQEVPDGLRAAIGGKDGKEAAEALTKQQERIGEKKVKYRGRKDLDKFEIEKVSPKTTYEQFLRKQPLWFVQDVLGKTRAKLFLDGKLPLSRFTDMSGRNIKLSDLILRDEEAFKRAGIVIQ